MLKANKCVCVCVCVCACARARLKKLKGAVDELSAQLFAFKITAACLFLIIKCTHALLLAFSMCA